MDVTPAVGAAIGANGGFVDGGSQVGWIITQPTAGVINWQVSAGSTVQTGSF
jgi:hypothetical protein